MHYFFYTNIKGAIYLAEIKPFGALRFTEKAGKIEELACPPYDIISEQERVEFLTTNPHNVIRLELPRDGEDVYAEAGKILNSWMEQGVMATDEDEYLYIYEEAFTLADKNYSFKGLICHVKIEEFSKGVVLPHENTLSAAKEDRFNLMCATGCNFSQIYSLYTDKSEKPTIEKAEEKVKGAPLAEFTDKARVTHRLWRIPAADCTEICADFNDRKLYIADGHHRYETALRYRDYQRSLGAKEGADSDYVMMMLVPMESKGLVVFPTHRIVHSLTDFDAAELIKGCRSYFDIGEMSSLGSTEKHLGAFYQSGKMAFGLYQNGKYRIMSLKNEVDLANLLPGVSQSLRQLDVTILHSLILERILGIDAENLAKQINLSYTRDSANAVKAVDDGANCAFLLNPTKIEQIAEVAAAGEKMPQKSTYFYPKLITGLVMNKMKDTK